MCDPIPLDNLKNHTALPYITGPRPSPRHKPSTTHTQPNHLHQTFQHICKIFPTSHQIPHKTQSNHQMLHQTLHCKHQCNHLTLQQIHLIKCSHRFLQYIVPQLSWSYFKPEFSGKPEEDAIATFVENK